jgi:hypothetical protein
MRVVERLTAAQVCLPRLSGLCSERSRTSKSPIGTDGYDVDGALGLYCTTDGLGTVFGDNLLGHPDVGLVAGISVHKVPEGLALVLLLLGCQRSTGEDIRWRAQEKGVGHVKNCFASGNTSNSVTANSLPIAAATSRLSRCNAILRRATPSAIPAKAKRVATAG